MRKTHYTCSYHCPRHECIAAQRDELREKLEAETARLEWCISVLFKRKGEGHYLTTAVGCGCCGNGLQFAASDTGREAIDAAREITALNKRLGVE